MRENHEVQQWHVKNAELILAKQNTINAKDVRNKSPVSRAIVITDVVLMANTNILGEKEKILREKTMSGSNEINKSFQRQIIKTEIDLYFSKL